MYEQKQQFSHQLAIYNTAIVTSDTLERLNSRQQEG